MAMAAKPLASRWLKATHRVFLGVFFNYAAVVSAATALAFVGAAIGRTPIAHSLMWTMLAGFFVYFLLLLWAFIERKAWRLWAVFSVATGVSIWTVSRLGGDPTFGFG